MTQSMMFLRLLLWVLAVAFILNAALAMLAYGDGGLLGVGGFVLVVLLLLTSPRGRELLTGRSR